MKRILLFLFLLIFIPLFSQNNNHSIGFKENKGQIIDQNGKPNNAVKYLLNTNGLNVQLKQNGFSYDIYETKKIPIKQRIEENNTFSSIAKNDKKTADYTLEYIFHRIDIDFVNSNPNAELISSEQSQDYDNYYNIPNHPEGIVGVHQYKQITYKNIYPNIDVVFSIPKDSLKAVEYNFVVHPKGKISDIQLKFNGAKNELVDNKIRMNVRFGKMEETLPASWTEDGMIKKSIDIGYKKIKNNVYGFNTSNAVNGKTVIIDPVPIRLWGTYYGGNGGDYSSDICNDSNNNVYFSGYTRSTTNIATIGLIPESTSSTYYHGYGFVTKFDANGNRVWGTYYSVTPSTIKVDSNGNLYFTGTESTNASNVTTLTSHQPLKDSNYYSTAYLVKLNSSGVREWGTYYGAGNFDFGNDLCIDKFDNIYLVGKTQSSSKISTTGSYQPTHAAGYLDSDGYIAKFNPQGIRIWGTYYGGTGNDDINSCHISDDGFLYIMGNTRSNNGIATTNSYEPNIIGYSSGMIAKFTLDGMRIWGSYCNGSSFSSITKSTIKENFLYIIGKTDSHTNLISTNTFNPSFQPSSFWLGSNYNNYVIKFDLNTQKQIWGTYFGEIIQDIAVNSKNKVIFEGVTSLTSGIATANAYSISPQYGDAYMIKLDENGKREWGTYYGGNSSEGVNTAADVNNKISIDNLDNIYLVGNTQSSSGISTPGAHQEHYSLNSLGGLYNIYLAKFQDCLSNPITSSNSPICIGNTLELKASGGTDYLWSGPNGFTSTEQNPIILNTTTLNSGEYSCLITGTGGCDDTKKVDVVIGDIQAPVPDLATLPMITGDCHTQITTIPTATDICAGAITGTTTSPLSYNLPGTYTIIWNYNDGNGNSINQNQTVTITRQPLPVVNTPQTFCIQQNAPINNITITGQNVKWYDALTNGNLLSNATSLQNGKTYYASQTINGCESERIAVLINIQNTPAPTADTNQSFCSTQNATLNDIEISGTNIKWYNSSNIALPNTTLIGNNATYYATQTINNCESINKLAINTTLINTLNANNYKVEFCDENNDGKETINLSVYNQDLIANPSDNSFTYYTTLTAAENQIANNRINNINNYVLPTGSYTVFVRIDSPNGCHQVVELGLNLYSKPIIPINDITPICEGSSITVNAGAGYDNYLWSTGETSPTITIQNPGDYSVTVTNNYDLISCSSTKDFTVKKSTIATLNSIETQDWTDNQNIIKVFVSGEGDFEYSIDGIHFQDSNEFSNVISGQYNVQVRDKNGCGTATEEVYLLMYPKFFTPNGDGHNDTWKIKFSDSEKNITLKIFDRYGKLLKHLLPEAAWNGQFNNQELPADDYWFIVTRADGKEYKGHFSLKR
ncbi:MAG TPA: T9SS type B sorting domain-containing protein [Flavobacterium sp.]|nr:T9SS type B sorting domain-containing protein [Flavobacterium sp.]